MAKKGSWEYGEIFIKSGSQRIQSVMTPSHCSLNIPSSVPYWEETNYHIPISKSNPTDGALPSQVHSSLLLIVFYCIL